MKLLHTSDWHIGRSLFEFSLLEDQQEIFRQIASIIEREQVDAVLISGDLYDRSMPSAQAVSLLRGVVVIVPAALALSALFALPGVWLAFPVSEAIVAVVAVALLVRGRNPEKV